MEFRLLYAGEWIKASRSGGHVWEKHALRKHFHEQLKTLWSVHPVLSYYQKNRLEYHGEGPAPTMEETIAKRYKISDTGFIPLVTQHNGLVCELDITFLRPGEIGAIVKHGGDIDNRLKVLLDSLQRPTEGGQIRDREGDEPTPNPTYCLLQDDSLITKLSVTVDRLLIETENQNESTVCAIIHVITKAVSPISTPGELVF
jgi:hypothetical protein